MLADASPSMQGLAQGVAAKPGPSADMLGAALLERNEGQAGRLAGDLDTNLGPALSPQIDRTIDERQAGRDRPDVRARLGQVRRPLTSRPRRRRLRTQCSRRRVATSDDWNRRRPTCKRRIACRGVSCPKVIRAPCSRPSSRWTRKSPGHRRRLDPQHRPRHAISRAFADALNDVDGAAAYPASPTRTLHGVQPSAGSRPTTPAVPC